MIQDPMPVIPEEEYRDRWETVQELMDQQGLDLILAYADDRATFGPAHARWLANFPVHFEPVCIVMPKRHDPVLLCGPESDRYALLSGQIPDVRVLKEFTHPDEDYPYSEIRSLSEIIPEILNEPPGKIGVAGMGSMPEEVATLLRQTLSVPWADVENDLSCLRAVKSPAEIEVIQFAYKIAELGLEAAEGAIREGVSEREVAAAAECAMRRAGAEGTGIDTIVASGPNSGPILARSTFRKIRDNELVLVTVAPRYEGYHGAIGRPVCVGNPGRQILRAVDVAERAQEACYREMRPGVEGRRVEAAGRRVVEQAGLGPHFLYSGVHSIGVIEFEPPIFGPSSSKTLEENMVISVDIPMFNTPWGGLRMEDGFLITGSGAQRINRTPHKLQK